MLKRARAQEGDFITWGNTLLEYYLGIDPDTLSDEAWGVKLAYLEKIRKQEAGKE